MKVLHSVYTFLLTALLAGSVAFPAWAQEDAMKDLPGYVDFGALTAMYGEPMVEIAVGQTLLNMVSAFAASEDPEAAQLFKRLQGVRIQVFEIAALPEGALDHVNAVAASLSKSGWEPVVKVSSPDEQVRIFMKINGDRFEGITVMAVDEQEAAFINVIGNLDPAELEKVMDNFDIQLDADNGDGRDDDKDSAGNNAKDKDEE